MSNKIFLVSFIVLLSFFTCNVNSATVNLFCTDEFDPVCCDHDNGNWVVTKSNPCLCEQYGGKMLRKGYCEDIPEPTYEPIPSPSAE